MRVLIPILSACAFLAPFASANDIARARLLESEGDSAGAIQALQSASSSDPAALEALADLLDRHSDPRARAVYEKLLPVLSGEKAQRVAKRLIVLDLIQGDTEAARRHHARFTASGGSGIDAAALRGARAEQKLTYIPIPGPLSSFGRMAALSADIQPENVLPALARNVVTNGYQAVASGEALEQTEYLKLVVRYLSQARELERLAAAHGNNIRIETCDSAETADLLRILGYRMRGGCGSDVVLETVNATRAFLTIDSGFPLAELEQALRTSRPFTLDYKPTMIPVMYSPDFWTTLNGQKGNGQEFIDAFLADPAVCRLYLGLSKIDPSTAAALRGAIAPAKLRAFAHVLDFYGGMFEIRNGVAIVPGGEKAWPAWNEFVGASPKDGAAFFERLLTRDDGWMAAWYDSVARISGPTQEYLLDGKRMNRFYTALRGRVTSPGPARPVFRASTDLMLLTQRLRIEPNGQPHIPGGLDVWKRLFAEHPHGKYDGKLTKAAVSWKDSEELLEALYALCRKSVENEPLKIFLALSDLNRFRTQPLSNETAERLVRSYHTYGAQYPLFSESPNLSEKTILLFLDTAATVTTTGDNLTRADAIGSMQALASLWQIFTRQGAIKADQADGALSAILTPFNAKFRNAREVFDAGRTGVEALLAATGAPKDARPQERIVDLLAGAGTPGLDADVQRQVTEETIRVMEMQRLVSLNNIFDIADNLNKVASGEKVDNALLQRLASRISEIQLPRASLSTYEKNTLSFGYWTEKHIEAQRKTNLRAAIDKAAGDPEKLRDIRGQLTPFLRDTLVGFSYAHYAPPGAQILQTNPLFVRSHDFLGMQGSPQSWKQTEVFGSGWPSSAGGRLVGSLPALPYALAEAEQNFLIPTREQALIWGDLVPQMIVSAKVPRWWSVTPAQLQWVSLHLNHGRSLTAEAAIDPAFRPEYLRLLRRYAPPARVHTVSAALDSGDVPGALEQVTPSELYLLASDWSAGRTNTDGVITAQIRTLKEQHPQQVSDAAISRTFGTPKPTLTGSYMPELLRVRSFPTLMGYSSRLMAESWESNLLYYAALAHEVHMPPARLNVAVPDWTRQTVENIFATHLEDWPALLRSLRMVGEEVRSRAQKEMAALSSSQAALQ